MALAVTSSCLQDAVSLLHYYQQLGERAMVQLDEAQLQAVLDPEMNSVASIVKHMAGNMRSRWTGFPEADGESPTRNRDSEFVTPPATRAEMMQLWEEGWGLVFAALAPLRDADLSRTVRIRGEAHSILQAIHRQLAHYAYHVGQIIFLAKHLRGPAWQSLSIPRGQSAAFTNKVERGEASQR